MSNKKLLSWICALALVLSVVTVPTQETQAATLRSSDTWATYYTAGGGNGTTDVVYVTTWSAPYVATVTNISGSCAAITINIKAYKESSCKTQVNISKTLTFTRLKSLSFSLQENLATDYTYFKVNMSYSGGSTAYTNGTVKLYGY